MSSEAAFRGHPDGRPRALATHGRGEELTFPVAGSIARIEVPVAMPLEARGRVVRTGLNAVCAQARRGAVRSPSRYAAAVALRGIAAFRSGTWAAWARRAAEEEDRLATLPVASGPAPLEDLLPALLAGHSSADGRIPGWTRLLLGHPVGDHSDGCVPCLAAASHAWWQVLRACRTQPRTLANYGEALLRGGFLDRTHLAPPLAPGSDPEYPL